MTKTDKQIGTRTKIDFSNHELSVIDHGDTKIYHLKKPDTSCDNIKYIASGGILAITGDYGNWIFDKEFRPDINDKVSDQYWCDKLKMSSCQEPYMFDSEATIKEIKKAIKEYKAEYGKEVDLDVIEYYQQCIEKANYHELDYTAFAYREYPSNVSIEDVIMLKDIKYWLKAVFDGFDVMHDRLKK